VIGKRLFPRLAPLLAVLVALTAWTPGARASGLETTNAILDSLQYGAFRYFWYQANPANGMVRDRSTTTSPASIAAVGFGLTTICIGVDHGWVTRADAAQRVLTTLNTFWNGPQGSATSPSTGTMRLSKHAGSSSRTHASSRARRRPGASRSTPKRIFGEVDDAEEDAVLVHLVAGSETQRLTNPRQYDKLHN
jgi:hypothetical protein